MSAREFLRVLGDKYSVDILEATGEARSAQELHEELDIPLATCYRRLEALSEQGILEVQDGHSDHGRRTDLFRRAVDEVQVSLGETTAITTEERATVSRTMDRLWQRRKGDARGNSVASSS